MQSLTRDQVRSVDQYAIETLGVDGLILMENAGRNATDAICRKYALDAGKRVAIVAGSGNNGGDGYVIARHLLLRGVETVTYLTAPREKISGDAEANLRAIVGLGLEIRDVSDDLSPLAAELAGFDLIVDAVGGTGIRGALRRTMADVVERINAAGVDVAAVDIPTGLDCDDGAAEGPAVRAGLTVTFVARKAGFDNPASRAYTGEVVPVDIGIPGERVYEMARRSRGE